MLRNGPRIHCSVSDGHCLYQSVGFVEITARDIQMSAICYSDSYRSRFTNAPWHLNEYVKTIMENFWIILRKGLTFLFGFLCEFYENLIFNTAVNADSFVICTIVGTKLDVWGCEWVYFFYGFDVDFESV